MVTNEKFILQPSYYLLTLLALIHLGSVCILWQLDLYIISIYILSALTLISFVCTSKKYALLTSKKAITCFWREQDGSWCLIDKTEKVCRVELLKDSVKTLFITLLSFRSIETNKKYTAIVMPDSFPKNIFRRLRVLLFAK